MESYTDQELKQKYSFDRYGRYAMMRDVINANRKEGETFRILDVGGRDNILRFFLPNDEVQYLDPLVPENERDEYFIEGDGCDIPLEDNAFDWLVSGDVLEHIPEELRTKFIDEQIRVAKRGAMIVAPFYSPEAEQAEKNANQSYVILSDGKEHPWLTEHLAIGLPRPDRVEVHLAKTSVPFHVLYNNDVLLWSVIMGMYFVFEHNNNPEITALVNEFNVFYNTTIFPHDRTKNSYRRAYILEKDTPIVLPYTATEAIPRTEMADAITRAMQIIAVIDTKHRAYGAAKGLEGSQWEQAVAHYKKEIAALNEARDHYNTEVQNLNTAVEHFKSESAAKSNTISDIEITVKQQQQSLEKQQQSLEQQAVVLADNNHELLLLIEELHAKNTHIEAMEQTLAWKLRNRYFALKKKIRG